MAALKRTRDLSTIDFVGLEKPLPDKDADGADVLAFVCSVFSEHLDEAEDALRIRKQEARSGMSSRRVQAFLGGKDLSAAKVTASDGAADPKKMKTAADTARSKAAERQETRSKTERQVQRDIPPHIRSTCRKRGLWKDIDKTEVAKSTSSVVLAEQVTDLTESKKRKRGLWKDIDETGVAKSTSSVVLAEQVTDLTESKKRKRGLRKDIDETGVAKSTSSVVLSEQVTDLTESKKRKRSPVTEMRSVKVKKITPTNYVPPEKRPGLPEKFKEMISGMGGTEPELVIQRMLTATDAKKQQNRLAIPFKQVLAPDFLTEADKALVDTMDANGHWIPIPTQLIDPNMKVWTVNFKKWDMKKPNGGNTSRIYVVNGTSWSDLVAKNGLRGGDEIQVWAFRVADKLRLALIRLEDEAAAAAEAVACS